MKKYYYYKCNGQFANTGFKIKVSVDDKKQFLKLCPDAYKSIKKDYHDNTNYYGRYLNLAGGIDIKKDCCGDDCFCVRDERGVVCDIIAIKI